MPPSDGARFAVRHDALIAAPVEVVWDVIADLPRYGEWNPFVVRARSSLVVGEPIAMHVRLLPHVTQPQRETILECARPERLCWGIPGGAGRPLRSRRCHTLRAASPDRTHFRSDFELSGWLAPLVRALLGRRLAAGFDAATRALAARAEAIHGRSAVGLQPPAKPD